METLSKVFEDKYNKNVKDCTNEEIYHGLLSWTKEQLKGRGYQEGKKKIYYISAEFLIGKLLSNNLINLGVYDEVSKYLKENGKELSMIEEIEPEPSLGNGGLGRLASCYMDAATGLNYPVTGFSIRYEFGIFRQKIVDGWQMEYPDDWLEMGKYWLAPRPDEAMEVHFDGHVIEQWDERGLRTIHKDFYTVRAVPYDLMISGKDSDAINCLRLWRNLPTAST